MATYTAEQIESIGGSRWIRGSKNRVYINNWHEMVGLDVEYHLSGSVLSATLNGEKISNREADGVADAKVYWENGSIHTGLATLAETVGLEGDKLVAQLLEAIAQRVAEVEK